VLTSQFAFPEGSGLTTGQNRPRALAHPACNQPILGILTWHTTTGATMKLGSPTDFRVTPNAGKTEFRFLLTFPELPQPVEFEMPCESVMMLMVGLQRLQVRHKIPIPSQVRPRGKPKLRLTATFPLRWQAFNQRGG
jgi:hypothetical protein